MSIHKGNPFLHIMNPKIALLMNLPTASLRQTIQIINKHGIFRRLCSSVGGGKQGGSFDLLIVFTRSELIIGHHVKEYTTVYNMFALHVHNLTELRLHNL